MSLLSFFLLSGFFVFLYQKKILIFEISWPSSTIQVQTKEHEKKRTVNIYYPGEDQAFEYDSFDFVETKDALSLSIKTVLARWFSVLAQEGVIDVSCMVDEILMNEAKTELYISCNKSFLNKSWSIHKKLMLCESLLKTVREAFSRINMVWFLVQNTMLEDPHLDFSQGWPIEGFC